MRSVGPLRSRAGTLLTGGHYDPMQAILLIRGHQVFFPLPLISTRTNAQVWYDQAGGEGGIRTVRG